MNDYRLREKLTCIDCGADIYNVHFNTKRCKACVREYDNARRRGVKRTLQLKLRLSKWYKDSYKLRQYGMSKEDETAILQAQNNKCGICEDDLKTCGRRITIDHNHTTGKVRGILCSKCNLGLGHFNDNREKLLKAIDYLDRTDPTTNTRTCE